MIKIPEPQHSELHPLYSKWGEAGKILQRYSQELIVISDVVDEEDPDAQLTTMACSGVDMDHKFYPLVDPGEAPYHADMIVTQRDLAIATTRHDIELANQLGHAPIQQVIRDRRILLDTCLDGVVNNAPRSKKVEGMNGKDFLLAVFESGVRLYGTPDRVFEYVVEHPGLIALYQVPTKDHPGYRSGEQFRSARVGRSHRFPWHLKPIANRDTDLDFKLKVRQHFTYASKRMIPHLAFLDTFENVRLRMPQLGNSLERLRMLRDPEGCVGIKVDGIADIIRARVVHSLDEATRGEFSIYLNPAEDEPESPDQGGYLEFNRKVDDPNDKSPDWHNLRSGRILSLLHGSRLTLDDGRKRIPVGTKVHIVESRNAVDGNELAQRASEVLHREWRIR